MHRRVLKFSGETLATDSGPDVEMASDEQGQSAKLRRPQYSGKTNAAGKWLVPFYFYLCTFLTATCAAMFLHKEKQKTLAALSNFTGFLVENLAYGRGYVTCSSGMTAIGNVLCFHANRMPLSTLLLAGLIHIFGDRYRTVQVAKIAVVLLPVTAAFALAWNAPRPISRQRIQILIPILLFVSFVLPTQLIDAVNMQVEEGYSFCLLVYALAVLLFGARREAGRTVMPWRTTQLFALSVLGLYMTKSSMIVVSIFLVLAFCRQVRDRNKCMAVILIFLCGPVSWGLYTYRTGHFSLGTSVDGIDLHKGNYYEFIDRYPPPPGISIDPYDAALSQGRFFTDEWAFNAYHMRIAEDYMRAYPVRTAHAMLWKAEVFFFSVHKFGSERYSGWLGWMTTASMFCFRLLLWSASGLAAWLLWRGPATARWAAFLFLGTTFSVALPYLIGFALTRHASVLVLPSALFLCWCLLQVPTAELTA